MTRQVADLAEPSQARGEERRAVSSSRMPSRASCPPGAGLLAIALGYAVLESGGRSLIEWNVCLLSIGLAGLLYWYWLRPDSADRAPSLEPWLARAVVLAPAYVALQVVPLPLFLVSILSPTRAETVASLGSVMQTPTFASLTVSAAATSPYLLNIVAFSLTFLLVREITWRSCQRHSWAPAIPLIAIAAIEAGFGLVQAAAGTDVEGTYRSKNHFAGLLEMVLPITVACAIALLHDKRFRGGASPRLCALGGCALFGVAGVMLLGLVYSRSKMGFVAGLWGLFVMGALGLAIALRGAKKWLSLLGLAASCLLVFLFLPTDRLVSDFERLFSHDIATGEGRWPIWLDSLRLLSAYPLFGCGLGNYGTAFLKHQTAVVDFAFLFAHNDYLQLASELGALGFSIFAGLMLFALMRAIRAATQGRDWNTRALGLGCAGAMAAISVHSLAAVSYTHLTLPTILRV